MIDLTYKDINVIVELLTDEITKLNSLKNEVIEKNYETNDSDYTVPAFSKGTNLADKKAKIESQLEHRIELRNNILSEVMKLGFKFGVGTETTKTEPTTPNISSLRTQR